MFDKDALIEYEKEVRNGYFPNDLLDKLLEFWGEARIIFNEIDRIYKTVVEEGLPEVADMEIESTLEKAFQRVVKERMSEAMISK